MANGFDAALFLTFAAACAAAASTGVLFRPGRWYESLDKPGWTPPNRAFPIVWALLYLGMAFAAMRVAQVPGSGQALALWAAQIALNTLWTPVFFGLRRMRTALAVIGPLWVFVLLTLVAFWRLDTWAGALLVPYLAWVTLAAALNLSVLRRNPQYA